MPTIKPRYRRDLPMHKDGERADVNTNSEDRPRRSRRRRSSEG